ncbi:hypothetical protein IM697_38385 [Streptomyces ferrugineus]|uniref:TPM domain-containing protein n=1 Tax=Streptomyces ferrugineus TaxID=1413221 RepID=A0A7M2SHU1_9ACTN|nr:hypothetical protein [Streptomyces ferrugineus]QOV35852.1 hypothetical protein IM697_38385 [Streptomyces ferrugineus]
MTSSLMRGRPRRARPQIPARVVQALVGGLVGLVWLVLPGMTVAADGGSAVVDFVMPVAALVTAVALAGFGFLRRRRRARGRTTPGGAPGPVAEPPVGELAERARVSLVEADDWVRVSGEELGFVAGRFGAGDVERVEPFARVLRDARAELDVALRMRWQYEGGVPQEAAARRHALAGIVGRCEEVGRLLDGQAAAFDQVRGLEAGLGGGLGHALVVAEGRFRELTGRASAAGTALVDLGERYGTSATAAVTGHAEQAKDRLVFATTRLNQARQSADLGEVDRAAARLRAAEGAIAQAATFVDGIERLAGDLARAMTMVPAALTGGEAEIAGAREAVVEPGSPYADIPPGEQRAPVVRADMPLADVREEPESPYSGIPPGKVRAPAVPADMPPAGVREEPESPYSGIPPGKVRAPAVPADMPPADVREEPESPYADIPPGKVRAPAVPADMPPADVREEPESPYADIPPGELRARVVRADIVLAGVREELVSGRPYDPLDVLRRIVRAVAPVAAGRAGVIPAAAVVCARGAVAGADDVVATHRAAVGGEARTRLAEARRLLASPAPGPRQRLIDLVTADTLAQQARDLAEQDIRVHGHPIEDPAPDISGLTGAVLGGILLGGEPKGGPPACFGGPRTRRRRGGSADA